MFTQFGYINCCWHSINKWNFNIFLQIQSIQPEKIVVCVRLMSNQWNKMAVFIWMVNWKKKNTIHALEQKEGKKKQERGQIANCMAIFTRRNASLADWINLGHRFHWVSQDRFNSLRLRSAWENLSPNINIPASSWVFLTKKQQQQIPSEYWDDSIRHAYNTPNCLR